MQAGSAATGLLLTRFALFCILLAGIVTLKTGNNMNRRIGLFAWTIALFVVLPMTGTFGAENEDGVSRHFCTGTLLETGSVALAVPRVEGFEEFITPPQEAVVYQIVLAEKKKGDRSLNFTHTGTDKQESIQFTAPTDIVVDLLEGLIKKDMLSILSQPRLVGLFDSKAVINIGGGDLIGEYKVDLFSIRQEDTIRTKILLTLKEKESTVHLEMNSLLPTDTATVMVIPFADKEFLLSITAREFAHVVANEAPVMPKGEVKSGSLMDSLIRLGQRIGNRR
jgi:hypothetical protein